MIGKEDQKLVVDNFEGLYSRGSVDEVPKDHAQDCLNLYFTSDGRCQTRKGFSKCLTVGYSGGIRRFFTCTKMNTNVNDPNPTRLKLLLLDNSHNLYVDTAASPAFTLAGMNDFAALNVGNRTYISPNDGSLGFAQSKLQILNLEDGTVRQAAGGAPEQVSSLLHAANSSTAGSVPSGVRRIAVVYETDTGFWTPPGPKQKVNAITTVTTGNPVKITYNGHGLNTGESHRLFGGTGSWTVINDYWQVTRIDDNNFTIPLNSSGLGSVTGTIGMAGVFTPATVTATGGKKLDITNIPVGGAQVVKRILLATRAGEFEYFFVPDVPGSQGIIHDNSTTSCTIDFNDTDLVASADYLFDLMEAVPSGSALCKYAGRLVVAGVFPDYERLLVSRVGDFETFSTVDGFIQVQTERDGNGVRNCFVLRDTLYTCKFTGMFSTEDNGKEPSNWAVSLVDGAVGAYNYGTSSFTTSQPTPDTGDIILLASRAGLYLFDGVVRRPELTYKVQNIWLRINFAAFNRVTVAHDVWNHRIYVSMPLDAATEPNYLLVGDYTDGRDVQHVRWTPWTIQKNPTCVGMTYLPADADYRLRIGSIDSSSGFLWSHDPATTDDDGTAINSFVTLQPLAFTLGAINLYKLLNFRIWGNGTLTLTLTGMDGIASPFLATPGTLTLTATPGKDLQRQVNIMNEKLNLKIQTNATGHYFILDRVDVWGQARWIVRPNI